MRPNLFAFIKNTNSFQWQLFSKVVAAGLVLAIFAAFIYSYMASSMLKEFYEREGLQATENFSRLSELALLYESGDNAIDAALATLDFPGIKHVAIIDNTNKILLDEGDTADRIKAELFFNNSHSPDAKIIEKTKHTWHIVAPVFTAISSNSDDMLFSDDVVNSEVIGYVAVQVDTQELQSFQLEIFINNTAIGLLYIFLFSIVLNITLRRILKPMNALTNVMGKTTIGSHAKAASNPSAPEEIIKIADAYNQMISAIEERDARLRAQKDLLETEVALRTNELVQARDSALEANNHKTEFLANVTHELRTPLQSILGYSEVIKELLEDEGFFSCDEDVDKITSNAEHLLTLINSILDISKIEAGKMDLNKHPTDIKSLITKAHDTILPLTEKNRNSICLKLDIASELEIINTDEKKLFQILLNLLSNAAKFTEDGTITLTASIEDNILNLEISDTGIGISDEDQQAIFEPFRQIDGSETRKFVGTGLGLSITLRFIKLLGGDISLKSQIKKGSTFFIKIPIQNTQSNAKLDAK